MKCLHCDTPIDDHEASRCLRGWIARDVMKWEVIIGKDGLPAHVITDKGEHMYLLPDLGPQWYPDVNIAAAWEVVEKIFDSYSKEITVEFGWAENPVYAWHCHMGLVDVIADTPELAICRAAIKTSEEAGE